MYKYIGNFLTNSLIAFLALKTEALILILFGAMFQRWVASFICVALVSLEEPFSMSFPNVVALVVAELFIGKCFKFLLNS